MIDTPTFPCLKIIVGLSRALLYTFNATPTTQTFHAIQEDIQLKIEECVLSDTTLFRITENLRLITFLLLNKHHIPIHAPTTPTLLLLLLLSLHNLAPTRDHSRRSSEIRSHNTQLPRTRLQPMNELIPQILMFIKQFIPRVFQTRREMALSV